MKKNQLQINIHALFALVNLTLNRGQNTLTVITTQFRRPRRNITANAFSAQTVRLHTRLITFAIFIGIIAAAQTVSAATYTVDTTMDNGALTACTATANDCSLRGAITAANNTTANDTISFDATVFASARTITLTGGANGELQIAGGNGTLSINGTDANLLTVLGNNQSSIFFVLEGATVNINNLRVTGGRGKDFGGSLGTVGGGIINSGDLTLNNVMVSGNSALNDGGGIFNNGTVTLIDSTVRNNVSNSNAGGICNCQRNMATTTLINSTISDNFSSGAGGGIFNGGGISNGTTNVTNSTISGNRSAQLGGGISNIGDNTLNLTNTTITNNKANGSNTVNGGGGIINLDGTVNALNTIIAGNTVDAGNDPDFGGTLTSQGYNLIGNTSGTTITGTTTGNILNQNAQLAPLGNNGGATQTHKLLTGSPAIDKSSVVSGITTDQRGFMRPADDPAIANASGGNGSDIGAFEAANIILVVDNTTDNASLTACTAAANDCSLRGAILMANGTTADDTINFDPTVFASARTITLTGGANGELQIAGGSGTLTINGTGTNLLTVSGNNQSSIFFVLDGATVTISNLTVSGGRGKNFGGSLGIIGGGIINSGNLTLNNVMVSGNSGVNQGGGIYNNGSLTLINSTVSVNSSIDAGGGICNCQRSTAATTLINSTVSNNSSNVGGGIFNDTNSLMTITNSTINGNSSNSGGGILNNGDNATLNLTNVTMSGNSASGQGGAINTGSLVNLTNTTISGNSANQGGGILNTASVVNAQNTIIAGNSANSSPDFAGSLNSQGFNLIGNTTGTTISGTTTGNILNQNAQLAPLGNYGGPTQTHQLLAGSPAIDKGSAASGITTDQRGFARPVDDPAIANAAGGNGSDIGAFEVLAPTAASVTVSGRVIVQNNRGLRNARVIMTDERGESRISATTAFGYFSFTDVEAGATYILTVQSKSYQFEPQVLNISGDLTGLVFNAVSQNPFVKKVK